MPTHTPLTWKHIPEQLFEGTHAGGCSPTIEADGLLIATVERHATIGRCHVAEANAAFIERAVNSHAAFLAACGDIADQCDVYDDNRVIPDEVAVKLVRKIKDRARAAIKLAEGTNA